MRRGFTLIELLIAASLGMVILGLAVDQVIAYFRVQQTLMTRIALRHELEVAQTRLEQELRTAIHVVPDGTGYISFELIDANGDGRMDAGDRMALNWWRLQTSPLSGENDLLVLHADAPAIDLDTPPAELEPFFDRSLPHLVARHVTRFWIDGIGFNLATLHLEGEELQPHGAPIQVELKVRVARRTQPVTDPLPAPSEAPS